MKKSIHHLTFALLFAVVTYFLPNHSAAAPAAGRFFLMGSGSLHLENLRNSREASVNLLHSDGSINEAALTTVDRVFGFPTRERGEHISPRLLFMLSYFSDQVAPGKTIHIESAYRSPEYNSKIRKNGANAARTSTHMDGMALDFWIAGVDGKELWETVRKKNCCGVGHYGGKIIHLDAGRPRFWEAATSGTKTKEPDYNRHIYLSTDYDRYAPGETLRLSLSAISTFGFGVRPTAALVAVEHPEKKAARIPLRTTAQTDCLMIDDRMASRFLYAALPASVPAGRYQVELEFCRKPFAQMPDQARSSEIEIRR
jgi:uncharacterized protein YcbK (DUF882 family)